MVDMINHSVELITEPDDLIGHLRGNFPLVNEH